jgi:DNA-binding winged helix-turn-helix (wHTH) protein/Tfp pilus assembly protein PilF
MPAETRSPAIIRFATFEVDVRGGELRKQGKRIKLQEQPFQVLALLLQRPGELVGREELRAQLWPQDTFVDFDNGLNTAINKLREALGDSADNPRFVETLPRRGYRFLMPVSSERHQERQVRFKAVRKIAVGVGIFILTLTIAIIGLLWRSRQVPRLTDQDTIVLADFTNTTGEPVFDDTLRQGLRVQLEQSPFLAILADQKVDEQLKLMARPPGERLAPELARDLCQRVGSKAMLTGSISKLGTHYVIALNSVNCVSGDMLASDQVEADSREHVLKALYESATRMREKLGESLVSIRKYDAPEERTTTSLEALKAFSLGLKVWRAKGDAAGLPFFQRAVELDSKFATAYGRMGTIYEELGEITLAVENASRAYELRENVSARERLYIESHYHSFVTGDLQKAAQVYELWQQTYPRDITPYSNLADLYAQLGNYEKSLEEAREELRLYPNIADSYANVGLSDIALGRLDEAETVFKLAEERKLESEPLLLGHYQLVFLNGDNVGMEHTVNAAAGKTGEEDLLLSQQSDTEAYYGRLAKAREGSRGASQSARHASNREAAALWQVNAGLREAEFGNAAAAVRDATAALELSPGRGVRELAALTLALAGNVLEAQRIAEGLNKDFAFHTMLHSYWLPTIRAAIEINRRNPKRSIKLLEDAASYELGAPEPYVGSMCPVYVRGQAYLLAGEGKEAATEFQRILGHRGIVLNEPIGALAHLQIGRAFAMQGQTAKARAAYQHFLTLWKDADPNIPILNKAKVEFAKLEQGDHSQ